MSTATATLTLSLDVQPAPAGTGLDLQIPNVSVIQTVTERRAYSFTLANVGNSQAISFGTIVQPLVLMVSANQPVLFSYNQTGDGGNHNLYGTLVWIIPAAASNAFTTASVQAQVANTTVDVIICG